MNKITSIASGLLLSCVCVLTGYAYVISGTVVNHLGIPVEGVCVTLAVSQVPVAYSTTNAAGYYEFINLPAATYTMTPSKPLFSFLPAVNFVIAISTDKPDKNFIGIEIGRDKIGSIDVNGTTRTYRIHVPDGHSAEKKLPLVILLHGGTGQGVNMEQLTLGGFNELADSEQFIAVYPDGILLRWNDGRNDTWTSDDTGFISHLIDALAYEYNIDTKRVFCTGMSNGAKMTIRLAFELPDKISAFAPVAGANLVDPYYTVAPNHRPVPILVINGDADTISPYSGGPISSGGSVTATSDTIKYWAEHNGCSLTPEITWFSDRYIFDGTRAWYEVYASSVQADVILCGIQGGGHAWPSGFEYSSEDEIGKTCYDISANTVIWDFFKNHCNYKLAGYVRNSTGQGLPSVEVTLKDGSGNVVSVYTTTADGHYEFSGLAHDSYSVTCSKQGVTFTSSVTNYLPLNSDIEYGNFYAASAAASPTTAVVYAWPNPCRLSESNNGIVFAGLPAHCWLSIYTLAGDLVFSIELTTADGSYRWQARTDDGSIPASGIYIYHVKSSDNAFSSITGKIALIR